jgi:hypothetical protein
VSKNYHIANMMNQARPKSPLRVNEPVEPAIIISNRTDEMQQKALDNKIMAYPSTANLSKESTFHPNG